MASKYDLTIAMCLIVYYYYELKNKKIFSTLAKYDATFSVKFSSICLFNFLFRFSIDSYQTIIPISSV